jgi:hypothetical protein
LAGVNEKILIVGKKNVNIFTILNFIRIL